MLHALDGAGPAGHVGPVEDKPVTEARTYPVAIVGVGKIARDQHLPSIGRSRRFTVAAGVSRHAKIDGVDNFETIDAFLDCQAGRFRRRPLHAAASALRNGRGRHPRPAVTCSWKSRRAPR